jgi:hypothetical protein
MTPRARALTLVVGLSATLAAAPAAPAQRGPAPQPGSQFLEGTHAFRRIIYDTGGKKELTALHGVGEVLNYTQTLIVVLGDPSPLAELDGQFPGGLRGFVEGGGALLVATDHEELRVLRDAFSVTVTGELLNVDGGGERCFRGKPECPYIDPLPGASPPLFEPALPASRNLPARRLATNLPSNLLAIGPIGRRLPVLATLPAVPPRFGIINSWTFAVGGEVGLGRALVMADHSVFINEMMLQRDNGNIDFAYRCAEWLLGRPAGQRGRRTQVLYYDDGTAQTKFDIPLKDLPPPPLPPPDTLMGLLDETLHKMEEEGTFVRMEEDNLHNQFMDDVMDGLPLWKGARSEWKFWTLAVIVASVSLGLYGFVRLGAFRHRPELTASPLAALLQQQAPAGAAMAERQAALLRDGNLWEAARELARHLFVSAGASPDEGREPPAIAVSGGWWRRRQAGRHWQQLWQLARSARPVRVSPWGFTRLAARVRALQVALADGTVRIVQ